LRGAQGLWWQTGAVLLTLAQFGHFWKNKICTVRVIRKVDLRKWSHMNIDIFAHI
jgi:hypothetical protein